MRGGHGVGRVVAVGDRGTEYGHDAVADMLVDVPAMLGHEAIDPLEEGVEERVHILRVEPARQRRITGEVGEQDADLPPLAFDRVRRHPILKRLRPQLGNRLEQASAVPDRADAEILEVVGGQRRQQGGVDGIVLESLGILPEAKATQPAGHVQGRTSCQGRPP